MLARRVDDSLRLEARMARAEIQSGGLRGPALVERLLSVPYRDRDVWTDELLGLPEPPPDIPDLPRGAVPYLTAGVEEILTMVREAPLRSDDELVDLGSGLGRVVILAHLLSGARARGIEIQRPLVEGAIDCCRRLGLAGSLPFVHGDAAGVELDGSVFFLYSPFNGETLTRVMRRLEAVARRRPIVVCAVGLEFPTERWLQPRRTSSLSLTLYDSRVPDVTG
jgi:hypothetical protein